MRDIRHFVNGSTFEGASGRFGDVFNPNTGEIQARVQLATPAELDTAVVAAQAAFPAWSATNLQRRARVRFEFKRLDEANKLGVLFAPPKDTAADVVLDAEREEGWILGAGA